VIQKLVNTHGMDFFYTPLCTNLVLSIAKVN